MSPERIRRHYKFHISWRSCNANYFPFLQFFVFTPTSSTKCALHSSINQHRLVSTSPSSICTTTIVLSFHSRVILDECYTMTLELTKQPFRSYLKLKEMYPIFKALL